VAEATGGDNVATLSAIAAAVRLIPDFPKPGIQFRDITTLIADPVLFGAAVEIMAQRARAHGPDAIVAVEARGFLFGAPIALALGLPLVPVRKPGKLPGETHSIAYGLEYGSDRLELHTDAVVSGARVVLIDDLLATGGTIGAAAELVRTCGGDPVAAMFLIALDRLGGDAVLAGQGVAVDALLRF
jgi:adenine phosphoribosyltransferase